jgi:predicted amidophosphoribosyltransferase
VEKKAEIDCGHIFCVECIKKWAAIENTCPYCKQEFSKIIEKVFLKSRSKADGLYKRRPKFSLKA